MLKVIIESAALTDEQIVGCCEAAERAGADFVKTSTGFHPAGGASVHAVELMARTVGGRLGVKASGGIRTTEAALAMIDAGATRLGLSGTRAVLDGLDRLGSSEADDADDSRLAAPAASCEVSPEEGSPGGPVAWSEARSPRQVEGSVAAASSRDRPSASTGSTTSRHLSLGSAARADDVPSSVAAHPVRRRDELEIS